MLEKRRHDASSGSADYARVLEWCLEGYFADAAVER
jgi:hypothetical protein